MIVCQDYITKRRMMLPPANETKQGILSSAESIVRKAWQWRRQTVDERDRGTYDWTRGQPINPKE